MPTLASSVKFSTPVTKATITKTLQLKLEYKEQKLIYKFTGFETSKIAKEGPGQYN